MIANYKDSIPNPDLVDFEIAMWQRKWKAVPKDERPESLASAIKICDSLKYQNLYTLLKIGFILPVTSCECEKSYYVLRRLKTWLRSTMTTKRLTSLAMMNIHYDTIIDYNRAVNVFLKFHPRIIDASNVLSYQ